MSNKNYFIIAVVVLALLLLGVFVMKPAKLGGTVHNVIEQFSQGILIGSSVKPACLKISDRDSGGGFTYVTYQDGVQYVTGGTLAALTAGDWVIPDACTEASLVDIRAR